MPTDFNPTLVVDLNSAMGAPLRGKAKDLIGRVVHVVTGPNYEGTNTKDPYYNNPTDIGSITFQLIGGLQDRTLQSGGNPVAKPISSAIKQLPLEGELVLIQQGPSIKMNESKGQRAYFYSLPYNVWNASHHNAFPDLGDVAIYTNQVARDYEDSIEANQPTNLTQTGSASYPLSPSFLEKSNIKSLRPFVGDLTIEGRWGNSIRFGSTTANKQLNSWSRQGTVGSPITIIRNGQGRQLDPTAWVPLVEDINRDPASIYLTNGQEITINDLNNFSLASLGVNIQQEATVAIPVAQQLTSFDNTSPSEQDQRLSTTTNV